MIEVKNLVKEYNGIRVLDNISFTMENGKIYGFLGPNGAGKSTTMNIMTGYLAPTGGSVMINGHDILKDAAEAKKNIGFLPEIPPVYPDMTVSEYLFHVGSLKKIPKGTLRDAVVKALQMTSLGNVSGRLIMNLSKGYRQRVGFAGAIIGFPEIIILDEPTVGMDPQQIIEIRNLISSLKEKSTVVLSSHILSEVAGVCDEIIIISHGSIIAKGTVEELENKYLNDNVIFISLLCGEEEAKRVLAGIPCVLSADVIEAYTRDKGRIGAQNGVLKSESQSEEDGTRETGETGSAIDGANTLTRFKVTVNNKADDAEIEIGKALLHAGIAVTEMSKDKKTLEEVFLRVTSDDAKAAAEVSGI